MKRKYSRSKFEVAVDRNSLKQDGFYLVKQEKDKRVCFARKEKQLERRRIYWNLNSFNMSTLKQIDETCPLIEKL